MNLNRSVSGETMLATPFDPVFSRLISDNPYGDVEYYTTYQLSDDVKGLFKDGNLTDDAVGLLKAKLNVMCEQLQQNNIRLERFKHTRGNNTDVFDADLMVTHRNDTYPVEVSITLDTSHDSDYRIKLFWGDDRYETAQFKERVETIVAETVAEVEPGAPAARQLDFGEDSVDNRPRLHGRNDDALKFHEVFGPLFSFNEIQAKPIPVNNTVFDQEMNEDVMLSDFMMPGGKLVFSFNGKQTGISYAPLMKKVRDGEGIFYECTRVFPFNPDAGQMGMFEFDEIYADPYIELALTSRFYIPIEDFNRLLQVPVHPYWEIKESGKTLKAAASRSSVVAGGPIMSQLHCQDGSDLKVYSLEPYMPTLEAEEEEEPEDVPTVVTFQRGEERTPMDISQNARVGDVKKVFADQKGLNVATLKLIFMGRLLKDDDMLTPGTVVQIMGGVGGRRQTYRRRKNGKKTRANKKSKQ